MFVALPTRYPYGLMTHLQTCTMERFVNTLEAQSSRSQHHTLYNFRPPLLGQKYLHSLFHLSSTTET